MKKLTLTIAALIGLSMGAYAQGLIGLSDATTPGGVSTNTSSDSAVNGYLNTGNSFTIYLWMAASNSTTMADATAINAADATSGTASLALLTADSAAFTDELIGSETSVGTNGVTTSAGTFSLGTVSIANFPGGLPYTTSVMALEFVSGGEVGVLAFGQPLGSSSVPGLNLWPGQNLLLSPVPEPASLALAGLGGLSMLLFRRRNK